MSGRWAVGLLTLLLLNACAFDSTQSPGVASASPTPAGTGDRLRCSGGDNKVSDANLGWGFCYPATWHLRERAIGTTTPAGVDTTFDVIADGGLFGFMIVGSYDRASAPDLAAWLKSNEPGDGPTDPIRWGPATEAVQVRGTLKRYALASGRVYLLDLRQGADNLQLDAEMAKRLDAWVFG